MGLSQVTVLVVRRLAAEARATRSVEPVVGPPLLCVAARPGEPHGTAHGNQTGGESFLSCVFQYSKLITMTSVVCFER